MNDSITTRNIFIILTFVWLFGMLFLVKNLSDAIVAVSYFYVCLYASLKFDSYGI